VKASVNIAGHFHQRTELRVRVSLLFANVLLQSNCHVTTFLRIVFIDFAAVVFVHMASMKQPGGEDRFFTAQTRENIGSTLRIS
jgi:hypothetical protein